MFHTADQNSIQKINKSNDTYIFVEIEKCCTNSVFDRYKILTKKHKAKKSVTIPVNEDYSNITNAKYNKHVRIKYVNIGKHCTLLHLKFLFIIRTQM